MLTLAQLEHSIKQLTYITIYHKLFIAQGLDTETTFLYGAITGHCDMASCMGFVLGQQPFPCKACSTESCLQVSVYELSPCPMPAFSGLRGIRLPVGAKKQNTTKSLRVGPSHFS